MSEESVQEFPGYVERKSRKPQLLLVFVIVLILAIAALVALYLLGAKSKRFSSFIASIPPQQTTPLPTKKVLPTPAVTATPSASLTATPSAALKRSQLTITVLNGSGIPGAASKVSTKLTTLGYTVAGTGNAQAFTYEGLTIKVKQPESNYLPLLTKDLAGSSASISASIDDAIVSDAEIIVGK